MKLNALILAGLCLASSALALEVNYVGPAACRPIAEALAANGEKLADDELSEQQREKLEAYSRQLWLRLYNCEKKHR